MWTSNAADKTTKADWNEMHRSVSQQTTEDITLILIEVVNVTSVISESIYTLCLKISTNFETV